MAGVELDGGLDCALLVTDDDAVSLVQLQLVFCHDVVLVWHQARKTLGAYHRVNSGLGVLLVDCSGLFYR